MAAHNEDFVILAYRVLIQSYSVTDGQTDKQTDASTIAKTREALHSVAREKSGVVLNFARFDSLVCIVACSLEKSRSLSLVPFLARYRSLSLSLTGLVGETLPWLARPLGTASPSTCGLHHCPEIHLRKNSKLIYLAASALEVFSNWALYKLTYSFIHVSPGISLCIPSDDDND